MDWLLKFARAIDALNEVVGRVVLWLVLIVTLISSGNAVARYAFSVGSNAWLELQWYLFGAIFLLGAGYGLKKGAHVRIDLIAGRFSSRVQAWIDVFGTLAMLLPVSLVIVYFGWHMAWGSYAIGEMSNDPGGLIRWPAKIMVPLGFALLLLQGLSELVKRIAFLQGRLSWHPAGAGENLPTHASTE
jgi:TRAP-type mannitol/chloroaromatic compound transport system permease small subunit